MQGLDFQKMELSFTKGLAQKRDARLIEEPEITIAVNVEFDEIGGLRLRYPYASIGTNIFGGGTISDCRRIYALGSELLLFTKTALYSWSSQRSAWVLKGTHLATKIDERPMFVDTTDQIYCDRALLSGTVVYCWQTTANNAYIAAVDAATGAVILAPTFVNNFGSVDLGRLRLVALSTRILLFAVDSLVNLIAYAIDPAAPAVGSPTTIQAVATFNSFYDVEKIPGADSCIVVTRRQTTTSYTVHTVTAALGVTSTTKARTCDGPIGVACTVSGASAQIVRANGTSIQGDLITISTHADVNTAQALGSGSGTINQVTGAFVDSTTCHVWWTSSAATNATDWDSDYNTVTVANVVGTAARFIRRLALTARAFAYNSQAYVWLAFIGESSFSGASPSTFRAQLQNSNFLYRHDGRLVAKGAWQQAGGLLANCWLPNVQLTSGSTAFTFAASQRRIIPLGDSQTGFSDRGPLDVTVTFDTNEARRVAKLGETVYITGGELLQYDGRELVEVGFHLYPHYFGAIEVASGNLVDGTYTLKVGWRYDNARGERERSTTATHGQVTIASGPNGISIVSWIPLYVTHKTGIAVEVWRTAVNSGEPFFLATNPDPAGANPNAYVINDTTASVNATFNDEFADSTLTTKEPNPENASVLENLAPPAATLIAANDVRLFLAGCPGAPNTVAYSKLRSVGEIAAFHDALTVQIPEAGGDITGLAFLNETLVVFRETAIYALDGRGFTNTSEGQNYEPRLVSITEGAINQESIALTPSGLIFKSSKGWYLLNRGWATDYIGADVCDYDSETVYSAHVIETRHQVRIVTSGRVLMFDFQANSGQGAWSEWSIADGLHAAQWNGTYHYLATGSVKAEQASYSTADYGWDVEMLIHLGGLQGFARVRKIMLLGEVRGAGTVRVRVGKYAEATYFDDKTWTISPTTVGAELAVKHGPSQQQHKAIRVRLTSHATAGEKPKLSALSLELGMKPGLYRHLPAAQRQ